MMFAAVSKYFKHHQVSILPHPIGIFDMTQNLPEKGATLQRGKKTYAVAPHIPGGIIDPKGLRKIADVAEKYQAKALKLTSGGRIAIMGIAPEDIDKVWEDLSMRPGGFTGSRIRYVKICPGTAFCKRGQQDSVSLGLKLGEKYQSLQMPFKFKMGVSGCINSCSEPALKDIGLIGTTHGWKILVGGCVGARPRIAQTLGENLSEEEALALVDKLIFYIKVLNQKKRLGDLIEEMGFDRFKEDLAEFSPEAGLKNKDA
jgi:NAD(P)H-nitrite reductase large subunit